ncbi:hypothetical protein CR513_05860, partial [Mucuna pruriens]
MSKKEVKMVLLARRKPLFLMPTKICLSVSSLLNAFPTKFDSLLEEFKDVFPKEVPYGLTPLRSIEHHIDLTLGATLPNKSAYNTNLEEAKEIQHQLGKLIEKGWVRESVSPYAMLVILLPKKDGTWRMHMDCRPINNINTRYRYLNPHLDYLLDKLHGFNVFSKIDSRTGYHQIRIREGGEWKMTFKTKFGLYKWFVMPFGLSNALNAFMSFIGKCMVVYFDDILIYSTCLNDQILHRSSLFVLMRLSSWALLLAHMESKLMRKRYMGYFVTTTFDKSFELECDASNV